MRAGAGAAARLVVIVLLAASGPGAAEEPGRDPRNVKVVVEFRQQGVSERHAVQGGGGVVAGRRSSRAGAGVAAGDATTTTTRSSGIVVVVRSGETGAMLVAQDVPHVHAAYLFDYAAGRGYVSRELVWQRLGTGLSVRPAPLPGGQIRLTLTPWLSWVTAGGGGRVELAEAATDVVVTPGQRTQIGGVSGGVHMVTRRILGHVEERSDGDTRIFVTATLE